MIFHCTEQRVTVRCTIHFCFPDKLPTRGCTQKYCLCVPHACAPPTGMHRVFDDTDVPPPHCVWGGFGFLFLLFCFCRISKVSNVLTTVEFWPGGLQQVPKCSSFLSAPLQQEHEELHSIIGLVHSPMRGNRAKKTLHHCEDVGPCKPTERTM
eukprot:NODE_970_length_535_cov_227.556373_g960_i0.p1 GENE.NODE_970_length_535_cov_227.556373_g960_i0~~NODE_970_length_535_cov_227.556373_g960_i0.p1  ORF type:complete len:162 (+),score=28.82 NODE_970_length_535_cov_227.556373_g960_i0:29-487(+)